MPQQDASLPYVRPDFKAVAAAAADGLDVELAASGFQKQHQQTLEEFAAAEAEKGLDGGGDGDRDSSGEEGGEEGSEEGSQAEEDEGEGDKDGEDQQPRGRRRRREQQAAADVSRLSLQEGEQQSTGSGEVGKQKEGEAWRGGEDDSGSEGEGSEGGSRHRASGGGADRLLVQQRLNQQQKRATHQAVLNKASRNATKPKGKRGKATAAAMSDW
jgi:hypothetical protein